jgi:hypothetical protein
MDADGKGEYPKFLGSFECRVNRPIGPRSPWLIETDVELKDAAGKFTAFPYFLEHVTGKVQVREGYVDIVGASMKKGDSSLAIDGKVTWRAGAGGRPLEPGEIANKVTAARPDLKITARNVPIDKELLGALPEDRRAWLQKVGLTGVIDIDGRIWWPSLIERDMVAPSSRDSELTHAFDIALHSGTIWPLEGTFAVSNLNGNLRLLPDRVTISQMSGKRGQADLSGRGEVAWPANQPSVFVSGTASRLELDRDLYRALPPPAQSAWDAVAPEGVVDVDVSYNGLVGVAKPTSGPATTSPSSPLNNLELIISPVKLAATVKALPYRLTDLRRLRPVEGRQGLAQRCRRQARRRRHPRPPARARRTTPTGTTPLIRGARQGRRRVPPRAAERAAHGRRGPEGRRRRQLRFPEVENPRDAARPAPPDRPCEIACRRRDRRRRHHRARVHPPRRRFLCPPRRRQGVA